MSASSPVTALVVKEVRATWLVFAGCFVVMVLPRAIGRGWFAEPAYLLGAALLGALAIGHEYSSGTLVQALAQPIRRAHLLATKLAVLAVMLAALGGTAWFAFSNKTPGMTDSGRLEFLLMPLLLAFCVAPWLTMISRGPTGGAVFSFGLPGLLWSATLLTYYAVYRREPSPEFALAASWRGGLALCAIGAVMTWRMFLRLEAVDGPGREIQLLRFRTATTTARRRHPVWALVAKDFRLQQMTLAFVVLYCVAWPVCALVGGTVLEAFHILSILFAVLVALLSGSLSSAEERQLGTFESQTLLPVPALTQWTSKVLVALTVTLLLGIGLPYFFMTLAPSSGGNSPRTAMFLDRLFVMGIGAIMCAGLYASSLATSGVRALISAVPLMFVFAWFVDISQRYLVDPVFRNMRGHNPHPIVVGDLAFRATRYAPDVLIIVFLLATLRLAFENHRSADRSVRRIAIQVIGLLALAIVFMFAIVATAWMRPPVTPFRR